MRRCGVNSRWHIAQAFLRRGPTDTKQHKAIIPCRLGSIHIHLHKYQARSKIRIFGVFLPLFDSISFLSGCKTNFYIQRSAYMISIGAHKSFVGAFWPRVIESGSVMLHTNLRRHDTELTPELKKKINSSPRAKCVIRHEYIETTVTYMSTCMTNGRAWVSEGTSLKVTREEAVRELNWC